eukprot:RCo035402
MGKELEEGTAAALDFTKLKKVATCSEDVVPVVVQHAETKEVLVIAYANKQALDHTLKEKIATFWSTSRNELWVKGLTSGDYLKVIEVRVNCEQNSLLYLVVPMKTGVCHTKDSSGATRPTCYYRRLLPDGSALEFVEGMK